MRIIRDFHVSDNAGVGAAGDTGTSGHRGIRANAHAADNDEGDATRTDYLQVRNPFCRVFGAAPMRLPLIACPASSAPSR